jgi:outer membrane protein assembly factor BamD
MIDETMHHRVEASGVSVVKGKAGRRRTPSFLRGAGLLLIVIWTAVLLSCAAGIPSIPNSPEAVIAKGEDFFNRGKYFQARELFKSFLEKYPGHDLSDKAQFYVAECYFNDKEYPLAAVEYRVLVSNYGYSEYVDDAFFKTALCAYKQSPRADLDQSKSFEAISLFEQFIRTFPKSPLVEKAHEYINELHKKLAEKDFKNGYYYYKRKRYDSALIYFNKVIEKYPGNEFWLRTLYYKGNILLARGETDEAKECFSLIARYPGDSEIKRDAENMLSKLEDK